MEIFDNEIWKDIPNYEGIYQASNMGRIKSFYGLKEKILKPKISHNGYYRVALYKNSTQKWYQMHRLVWEHLMDRCPKACK